MGGIVVGRCGGRIGGPYCAQEYGKIVQVFLQSEGVGDCALILIAGIIDVVDQFAFFDSVNKLGTVNKQRIRIRTEVF